MKDHGRDAIIYKMQEKQGTLDPAQHDLAHIDAWMAPINENIEAVMAPAKN
jgi:hypothetical protein